MTSLTIFSENLIQVLQNKLCSYTLLYSYGVIRAFVD